MVSESSSTKTVYLGKFYFVDCKKGNNLLCETSVLVFLTKFEEVSLIFREWKSCSVF